MISIMSRVILVVLASVIFSSLAFADSITITAGGPATTLYLSDTQHEGVSAKATYALSADGKILTVQFQNTSTISTSSMGLVGFGMNIPVPNNATYSVTGLPPGANWGVTDLKNPIDFIADGYAAFLINNTAPIASQMLGGGQGAIGTLTFAANQAPYNH